MLQRDAESFLNPESEYRDKTVIVKRSKLTYGGKDCVVIQFQDISETKLLKHEQEKGEFLGTIYSSVFTKMVGSLKNNLEIAVRLIRSLKD